MIGEAGAMRHRPYERWSEDLYNILAPFHYASVVSRPITCSVSLRSVGFAVRLLAPTDYASVTPMEMPSGAHFVVSNFFDEQSEQVRVLSLGNRNSDCVENKLHLGNLK